MPPEFVVDLPTVVRGVDTSPSLAVGPCVGRRLVVDRLAELRSAPANPIRRLDKPRIDRRPKVRFLDEAEESRLRAALQARDVEMIEARESANSWRRARNRDELPPLRYFGDHLTPAVLVSMNTGLRRGELLKLRWSSIDFDGQLLTVEGPTSKTRQTRHVPLNAEAMSVLIRWREQSNGEQWVFEITTGPKTAWTHIRTRAQITGFRWHDLRHHFASRLVQRGVPLNTVRDLLGHSSIAMTLRYAHLAPDQRREAVAKINDKPISALTMRLSWDSNPRGVIYPIDFNGEMEGLEPA
jgi:integrase